MRAIQNISRLDPSSYRKISVCRFHPWVSWTIADACDIVHGDFDPFIAVSAAQAGFERQNRRWQ